jgi:hypothetical protein
MSIEVLALRTMAVRLQGFGYGGRNAKTFDVIDGWRGARVC